MVEPSSLPPSSDAPAALSGGVLVGGKSRRMGEDKASLRHGEHSFLEIAVAALSQLESTYLIGAGPVDLLGGLMERNPRLHQLDDLPSLVGPLAGMLAAMRQEPTRAFVFVACDLPRLGPEVVSWLIDQRRAGRAVLLPMVAGRLQPLVALYEPESRPLLESLVAEGLLSPSRLAGRAGVVVVEPPQSLRDAFLNVNTPEQLRRWRQSEGL